MKTKVEYFIDILLTDKEESFLLIMYKALIVIAAVNEWQFVLL